MGIKKISLNQIINIVILCIAGLVAINIFKGQNKKVVQLRQIYQEQRQKNAVLNHIGNLKKRIGAYKENFRQRDRREIINSITSLATSSGVKIISLTPLEQIPGGVGAKSEIYDRTFFELTIQVDSYHQLGRFISKLESGPIMFAVNSLSLSLPRGHEFSLAGESAKMPVKLIISVIYFK